jgi:hypothetical protein
MKFAKMSMVLFLSAFVLVMLQGSAYTQALPEDSVQQESHVFYGGQIGLTLGDYFRISIEPLIGYRLTPRLSFGGKARYEYVNDSRYSEDIIAHNYGGGVFSNFFIFKGLYAHGEYSYMSYQYQTEIRGEEYETEREWVPFLFLGGGYAVQISRSAFFFIEATWDVIQDDNSPYAAGEPFMSVGVMAGI